MITNIKIKTYRLKKRAGIILPRGLSSQTQNGYHFPLGAFIGDN